jgi:hypothetical protein
MDINHKPRRHKSSVQLIIDKDIVYPLHCSLHGRYALTQFYFMHRTRDQIFLLLINNKTVQ